MQHHPEAHTAWQKAEPASALPAPLDCETLSLLRRFIAPILETAPDWDTLETWLASKGYGLAFREGHLVVLNDQHRAVCTGHTLGVPLRAIAARIGRPAILADNTGRSGTLYRA